MAKNILLIEAEDAFATSLTEALEARGAVITRTANGKEGLSLAESRDFDAILLCVELPRMSGYAVCNKLKKSDELKGIPLVIMSSEATPKTFEQHKKLKTRAEDYCIKPCEVSDVIEKVDSLIGLEGAVDETIAEGDEDLELLEDAFESLEMSDEGEMTVDDDEIEEIAIDTLDVDEDAFEDVDSADIAIDTLGEDEPEPADLAIDSLGEDDSSDDAIEALGDEDDLADDAIEALGDDEDSADDAIEMLGDEDDSADDAIEMLGDDDDSADDAIEMLGDDDDSADDAIEALSDDEDSADDALDALGEVELDQVDAEESLGEVEVADVGSDEGRDEPEPAAAPASGATARRLAKMEEENTTLRKERSDLESRLAKVEDDLRAKTNELDAFKAGGGGGSREALKLKSDLTQKNKEILSLKETINEKEKLELEWQEKETELELKAAELEERALQSEAQVKTLTENAGALGERIERMQAELEEAYSSGRQVGELEAELEGRTQERDSLAADLEKANQRAEQAEAESRDRQGKVDEFSSQLDQARQELDGVRGELEQKSKERDEIRGELDGKSQELDGIRAEADEMRGRLEQIDSLEEQIKTLEAEKAKNEDRALKAYQKLKGDEALREKTRKALQVALELLDEAPVNANGSEEEEEGFQAESA